MASIDGARKLRPLTWRHVECRATSKVGSDTILSGKSKVGQLGSPSIVHDKHVLRLEIPVEDASGVTMLDRRQELQENLLGLEIISYVMAVLGDFGKQVSFGAVFQHHIGRFWGVQNLDQGNDIGMLAGSIVQLNLSILKGPLSGIETDLVQGLDGILGIGDEVSCLVHRTICAHAKNSCQLDAAGQRVPNLVIGTA